MLMKTYLCFHCLENISSQQLYRAIFQVVSILRMCFEFHFHMVTYKMDLLETLTTG